MLVILLIAFGAGDTSLSYYLQHLLHVHCLLIRDIFRFYPRDAMRKRGLCCHPVSVCLSVTLMYYIQMAEDIVKLIPQPGSHIIVIL